jgi:hypothetical protein
VDEFPQIAGQIQGGGTRIWQDVTGILIGNVTLLELLIGIIESFMQLQPRHLQTILLNARRSHKLKTVLGAVPLTPLGKAAMPVAHQLMGTGSGDAFNLEGEVDMLKHTMVAVVVQVLHQSHRIAGLAVVADRCDICEGLNGVRGCLHKCYFHD